MSTPGHYTAAAKDPLNRYARKIIESFHASLAIPSPGERIPRLPQTHSTQRGSQAQFTLPPLVPTTPEQDGAEGSGKVGIIGGGIGGLYAAMMLQDAGIPYEILEASGRLGGRLYTHRFSVLSTTDSSKEYDYYDVGAMRFPKTKVMGPVFALFQVLSDAGEIELLRYFFSDLKGNSTACYNDKTVTQAIVAEGQDPWQIKFWKSLTTYAVKPFWDALIQDVKNDTNSGWDLMMKYDKYSMRAYVSGNRSDNNDDLDPQKMFPYPVSVVQKCETFDMSTGGFDRALTEVVLDYLAFSYDRNPIDWYCVRDGSRKIATGLDNYMSKRPGYSKPAMNSRVTRIAYLKPSSSIPGQVEVTSVDSSTQLATIHVYDHVITTTTLPCLRVVNLDNAGLNYHQKEALRSLQYGPAVKVGVKFRTTWWEDPEVWKKYAPSGFGPIIGGQSYTDKMARTVVYPSYGNDPGTRSSVLIVSYARAMDAIALGALCTPESREQLKRRMLEDLVSIHNFNPEGYAFLEDQWADMYPYAWHNDPNTMGAFGFFGPAQFMYLYRFMTSPAASGRLHFAGEGVSARHGWVVGALESSYRAVYQIVGESYPDKLSKLEKYRKLHDEWSYEELMGQSLITLDKKYGEKRPEKLSPEAMKLHQGLSMQSLSGLAASMPLLSETVALPPYV